MKLIKKTLAIIMLVCLFGSITATAYAANVPCSFTLSNNGKAYTIQTNGSNTKVYANDPSTVATAYNDAPGWGFAFCMAYYNSGYHIATVTSPGYWISGIGEIHPPYLSGQNQTGRAYYVGARIDDDYSGTYTCAGAFNSDYTTPYPST